MNRPHPTFVLIAVILFLEQMILPPLWAQNSSQQMHVEIPEKVGAEEIFTVSVSIAKDFEKVNISGNNFEFLGQSSSSISKTLVQGRFYEVKTYRYRMKPKMAGPVHLIIEAGGEKRSFIIQAIARRKTTPLPPPSSFPPKPQINPPQKNQPDFPTTPPNKKEDAFQFRAENRLNKKQLLINEIGYMETTIYSQLPVDSPKFLKRYNESCYQMTLINNFNPSRGKRAIGGKKYWVTVIARHIVYGSKSGNCTIESVPLRFYVSPPGFPTQQRIVDIDIPPQEFQVVDYPERGKPDGFSSHNGDFYMRLSLPSTEAEKNSPLKLSVTVSGIGNFNTLSEPIFLNLPPHLSLSKVSVIDTYSPLMNSLAGSKTYHYYLIPQRIGLLRDTPTVSFNYFSPTTRKYMVLKEKFPKIRVRPSSNFSFSNKDLYRGDISDIQDYLHPPILEGNFTTNQASPVMTSVWLHLFGIFSAALIFWTRKRDSLTGYPSHAKKESLHRLAKIKRLGKDFEKGSLLSDFERPPWLLLKDETVAFLQSLYDFDPAKSWDKEMRRLLTVPSKNKNEKNSSLGEGFKLTEKEILNLKKVRGKIKDWEGRIYRSGKNSTTTEGNEFFQDIRETHDLLKEILSLSLRPSPLLKTDSLFSANPPPRT